MKVASTWCFDRIRFVAVFVAAAACAAPSEAPQKPEAVLCPELGSNVDVLELPYSDDPLANARLKAFVATARGFVDAVIEMERLAIDACQRIGRDVGATIPPDPPESIQVACGPVRTALERMKQSGIEVRISLVSPRCDANTARESRCSSVCSIAGEECTVLCRAQAALYAQCTLPAVSVSVSSELEEVVRLARSLEQNLPELLYAELALGRRLVSDADRVVQIAAKLPSDVKGAGPRGLACAALASTTLGKAIARLRAVIQESGSTVAFLDPEVHPSRRAAR